MVEILILSAGLVALIALLCRRGAERVQARWVFGAFMAYGILLGVFLEGLPFSEVAGRPTIRTFIAALLGVFAMRLIARGVRAWALGYKDEAIGAGRDHARLLHPLIGLGIAISGILMIHEGCVARHMALEIANTPRSGTTGIVKGAEPIRLTQDDPSAPAVLLFHGFLGSPAELGDLPERLHAAGFAVEAPLLPGHGTTPAELRDTHPDEVLDAALAAYDALAATHDDVTVIGFSMGGFVATQIANQRDLPRLVLINPFTGEIFRPWYSPVPTDALTAFMEPLIDAVVRPRTMVRLNDLTQYARIRSYRTVPLSAVANLDLALDAAQNDPDFDWAPCPTLVLLSTGDEVTPPGATRAIFERPHGGTAEVQEFPNGNHLMLLDFDRDEAVTAIVDWLAAGTPR